MQPGSLLIGRLSRCSEWTLTGTTASGEKLKVRSTDLFEFKDGKIRRKDSHWKIVEKG
jgi:hypothetical protein